MKKYKKHIIIGSIIIAVLVFAFCGAEMHRHCAVGMLSRRRK